MLFILYATIVCIIDILALYVYYSSPLLVSHLLVHTHLLCQRQAHSVYADLFIYFQIVAESSRVLAPPALSRRHTLTANHSVTCSYGVSLYVYGAKLQTFLYLCMQVYVYE